MAISQESADPEHEKVSRDLLDRIDFNQDLQRIEYFVLDKAVADTGREDFEELLGHWKVSAEKPTAYSDLLPILSHRLVGGNGDDAIPLAAHWMLGNLAARIFDDVQDQDKDSMPWSHWSIQRSLPVALELLFTAQHCLTFLDADQVTFKAILTRWSITGMLASQGQQPVERPDLRDYFRRIIANTASLFSAACWTGARLRTDNPGLLNALDTYGHALGMVIQITNDARGVTTDLKVGRRTLAPIYALSLTAHPLHPELAHLLESISLTTSESQRLNWIFQEMGAYAHAYSVAHAYERKALDSLKTAGLSQLDAGPLACYVEALLG